MQLIVHWLSAHRIVNLLLILCYFYFLFSMHVPFANLSVRVMLAMSLPVYNTVVMAVSITLLILFVALMAFQLRKYPDERTLKITCLLITIACIILHFRFLFEMNIEIIHVFQYSILAFLLFPLTRRFGAAVFFAVPFMLIDEWHQYRVLYPGFVEYFEFNDVMIDIYGCGLIMVALMICGVKGAAPVRPIWRRSEFIFLLVSLIAVTIAIHSCFIALYEADSCANTWLVLNRIHQPVTFWRKFPGRDVVYHIMQPLEAIVAISAFSLFYFGLDSFRKYSKS